MASWPHWRQAVQMAAERSSAGSARWAKSTRRCSQVTQDRPFSTKAIAMCTDDIGHLEKVAGSSLVQPPRPFHLVQTPDSSALSSGRAGLPGRLRSGQMKGKWKWALRSGMPEQRLHGGQIRLPLQKMRGETVAK